MKDCLFLVQGPLQLLDLALHLDDIFSLREWETSNPLKSRYKVWLQSHSSPVQSNVISRVYLCSVCEVEAHAVLFFLEEEGWLTTQAGRLSEDKRL